MNISLRDALSVCLCFILFLELLSHLPGMLNSHKGCPEVMIGI